MHNNYEQSVLDILGSDLLSVLRCGERTNAVPGMLDSVLDILRRKTKEVVHIALQLVENSKHKCTHNCNNELNPWPLYMAGVCTAIKRAKQDTSGIVWKGPGQAYA